MAKIIVSCRFQKSAKDIADLIMYMATVRELRSCPTRRNTISHPQNRMI